MTKAKQTKKNTKAPTKNTGAPKVQSQSTKQVALIRAAACIKDNAKGKTKANTEVVIEAVSEA